MTEYAIDIHCVTKRFANFAAVDNVSLVMKQGEILGLLGPNGAGKSTLTNMISGLFPPDEGSIRIDGEDISKNRNRMKFILGIIPQEIVLYDFMNTYENLKFFGVMYNLNGRKLKQKVSEMIEYTGLEDDSLKKHIKVLSGGMKRRVNIAASLLHDPQIVLMDEPTVGLDPQNRVELWEIIRKLKSEGKTIVLTTHLMDEAQELCDRIAIMDRGKIIALGTPQSLMNGMSIQEAIIVTLEETSEKNATIFEPISGVQSVQIQENPETHGIYFRLLVGDADEILSDIVKATLNAGQKIMSIEISTPTLADVFLELTGRSIIEAERETEMISTSMEVKG
ncbi:MAG: ABC transporter ATP-binding protein [Candidatus Thorarchaeota archaeon]|nr:MAG: ABC transporter ATP-binding protein [Candidatus Thorarchaeota archaeon]